ncbi:MAG: flagellin FliC [Cyanobacteria bacterium]|nr:flagellin FliC [Cyanobacteriota bacterium]
MPLYINANTSSISAQRHLGIAANSLSQSLEKLSSGFRINRANDDAAGLQISELLRTRIRGSQKALDNSQDGINVLNIADGTYETIQNSLQRVRELVVQGASDTNGTDQRNAIKSELDQLSSEIDRIIQTTTFNGKTLLDGSQSTYNLQVGANGTANDQINVAGVFANNLSTNLKVDTANLTVNTTTNAQVTLNNLDTAIGTITSRRAVLGAFINRLQATSNNLSISIENQQAAEARVRNVDVAAESSKLVSNQILQQAASAILSQANQTPNIALQLLNGR